MTARRVAQLFAVGRIALGSAVLAAPESVTSHWLGEENAALPAVADLARGLAARDIALGIASLQTLGDPVAGPRIVAACAFADATDAFGTLLARDELPLVGVVGTVLVAGAAAVAGLYLGHVLAHPAQPA